MDFYDISTLRRDTSQNNLYDLTEPTFVMGDIAPLSTVVLPEQEMRLDLVSNSIYGTTNYVDLLMDLNSIDNPLNVKQGDTILYISLDQLDYYRITPNTIAQQRNVLLNASKSSKVSTDRQQYIENNYQLPPTFLSSPGSPIEISSGSITIKPIL
jgi:hypothetical protein